MKIRVILAMVLMVTQMGVVTNSFSKTTRGPITPNTRIGRYNKLAGTGDLKTMPAWQKEEYQLLQQQAAGKNVDAELAALAEEHPEETLLTELYASATPEEIKQIEDIMNQAEEAAAEDEIKTKQSVIESYQTQLDLRCKAIQQQKSDYDCTEITTSTMKTLTANVDNDIMDNDTVMTTAFEEMIKVSNANPKTAYQALTTLQNAMVKEQKDAFLKLANAKLADLQKQLEEATEQEVKDIINEEITNLTKEIKSMEKATTWAEWTKAQASAIMEVAQAHYLLTALGILAVAAAGIELTTSQISQTIKSSALFGTLQNYATECGISALEACKTGWATATSFFKQMMPGAK